MRISNVRLSFPALFEREVYEGKEGKYAATFLVAKGSAVDKQIRKAIVEFKKENKVPKISRERICYRDGDETGYDSHEGMMYIKATSKERPLAVDRKRNVQYEDTGMFYAGCIVNADIDFWYQNHKTHGKRINCNLNGIQFVGDDTPFGRKAMAPDEFEALEDESEGAGEDGGDEEDDDDPFDDVEDDEDDDEDDDDEADGID